MHEKKSPRNIDYSWLEGLLDPAMDRIAESLEQGAKISSADLVRLVEYHRETYGVPEPPPAEVIWVDDIDAAMDADPDCHVL